MKAYQFYETLGNVGIASFLLVFAFLFGMVSSIRKRKRILENGIRKDGIVISAKTMPNGIYVMEIEAGSKIYAVSSYRLKYHVGSEVEILVKSDDGIPVLDENDNLLTKQIFGEQFLLQRQIAIAKPDVLPILAEEMPTKAPAIVWGVLAVLTLCAGCFMVWYAWKGLAG